MAKRRCISVSANQIAEALHFNEIELAIAESAPGKLSSFRYLTSESEKFAAERSDNCPASVNLNSRQSSPVKEAGPGNTSTRPWSSFRLFRFRIVLSKIARLGANGPTSREPTSKAAGPDTRMTATPDGVEPEDSAKMVWSDHAVSLENPVKNAESLC